MTSQENLKSDYWDDYYASSQASMPLPTQFAAFVAQEVERNATILDVGCGSGRDSVFFAQLGMQVLGIDGSTSATRACSELAAQRGLTKARFVTADVDGAEFSKQLRAAVAESNGQVVVYARFFLHAITESEQSSMLAAVEENLRPGDILAVEYRTTRDSDLAKVTDKHYRRFIDPIVLNAVICDGAFRAVYAVEGFGYAKYRHDDAHVARALFVKTSQEELNVGTYARNILQEWSVGARAPAHRVAGEIIDWVIDGDFEAAVTALRATTDLTDHQKRALVKVLNEELLFHRELEWTNHNIRRSFRFWTIEEKVEYLGLTAKVMTSLRKLSPHVSLGFGSVLAALRDQDFIPHDDDMDVIFALERNDDVPTLGHALKAMTEALTEDGFTVHGDYPTHRNVNLNGGTAVDVFVGLIEDETVSWFPSARSGLRVEDVFPPVSFSFLGVPCDIPRRAEQYLAVTYGPDWRTPVAHWHHPWDLEQYRDLL